MLRGSKFKTRKNRGEVFVDEIHPEKKRNQKGKGEEIGWYLTCHNAGD